ncbi:carboxypeptidase regulatory-like domain-containing protein [Pontibacter sp. E15-1]|uniref:TonB-dependent receptor n=1 Tax=Pontibacter sp. E15-1 TaxID=2919918 RepID=UPI001F500C89|nr:carboxypeptidase regulatory-like domain-containing protein [Pontibacter sp. E15-1]MCJ8165792.1 carboxypeptidase regulatory-like domain-containing protein [Pontibacter sp. E15-1]
MRFFYKKLFLCVALCLAVQTVWAQGATTASLIGTVKDQSGATLPGATVIAVHTPTNTQYVAGTDAEGRYTIQNMRVGGPYTVRSSYVGYQEQATSGVMLSLGQTARIDLVLAEGSRQLSEVQVIGEKHEVFNQERTGAATNVSREQLENLPTLSRSLQDFTRLTPQASGNSIAGSNNRYNNITIDGAVNNDVFGLAGSGTPGGQAGTQPISLDAIEQIQVVVAPYDVKLGNFTGGGINAVTRSGSNSFTGSAYVFGRNEKTIGKAVEGPRLRADEFNNYQYGVRVGGPVLRDKVFFFFNYDATRITEPVRFAPGSAESQIPLGAAQQLASFVQQTYGYDVGSLGTFDRETNSDKFFGRLDVNISDNHQLTVRHNVVDAYQDDFSRSRSFVRFGNNAYQFTSTTNSSVLELNSRFGNEFSNKLILGYSRIRDRRAHVGALFPQVTIADPIGTFEFGAQRSSTANELDQDLFEITDNFSYIMGRHNFTVGTHNEFFKFRNLFINNFNGRWDFNSLDDFYAGKPSRVQATYSLSDDPRPAAEFNAMQLGFYVQDEYSLSEQLRFTLGLRIDIPVFPDEPPRNLQFEQDFGSLYPSIRTDRTPGGNVLWAPRFGFNYTPTDDRSLQLRGGTGVFTGRVPFVWLSNQFTNTGTIFGTVFQNNPTAFITDVDQQRNAGASNTTVEVNVVDKDFKLPQVWRSNLALDYTLPGDVTATVEGIYSKTLNDVVYRNLNLVAPTGNLPEPDTREVYPSVTNNRRINPDYTNVILLDNTDRGYRYSLTGELKKDFLNGLQTKLAYTYGKSKDVNSGTSSTALSNWEFNQVVNDPNNPSLSFSRFDIRHRIIGSGGYTFAYANNFSTSVSLFYQGQSGLPFTYLYAQDLNSDGNRSNDLLYVPRSQAEINLVPFTSGSTTFTPDAQWAALDAFIASDDYLSGRRGQYAERHGARMPWTHQFDVRLLQNFYIVTAAEKKHTLQLTFDIFNVGNLLNKAWGRQYFVSNSANEIIRFAGLNDAGQPTFTFNPNSAAYNISQFDSRWQGQVGIRYLFE